VREELLELVKELRGQGFVVREHKRGRLSCSIIFATVKVLPEPVTPSRT